MVESRSDVSAVDGALEVKPTAAAARNRFKPSSMPVELEGKLERRIGDGEALEEEEAAA